MKKTFRKTIPKILLVGAGRFGEKHLQKLKILEKNKEISILGAVVLSSKTQKRIAEKYNITVWTKLTDELLSKATAVDIVTPPESHYKLVMRCLPFANVLVEKPLTLKVKDVEKISELAKKHRHTLMVGHIFRFNPVVKKLKPILSKIQKENMLIKGIFINPASNDLNRNISFELPHLFDIVDEVIDKATPTIISSKTSKRINTTNIQYGKNRHAIFITGWEGEKMERIISFYFAKKEIKCDLIKNTIDILNLDTGLLEHIDCTEINDPLTEEISCFLKVINGKKITYPNIKIGAKIVNIAEKITKSEQRINKKPRVAIIGAGIFGANCAIELSKFCDVTLFERNNDIMKEASFVNQYRHHWGYHYPRSGETVQDIINDIGDFESLYERAIIRNFPTYYCIAKKDSKVSAKDYVKFCDKYNLPYELEYPDKEYVARNKVSISVKTLEPIYNHERLKDLVHSYIKENKNIKIKLNTSVKNGLIETNGRKTITIIDSTGKITKQTFDYVINSTYANYNQFTKWFNFPLKPLRIDLVEALIVKLPIPKISLAIMDGPFTNLVPTSIDHLFTLVHIKESILERYVPSNGLPYNKKRTITKVKETLKKSAEWLPILKKAELIETRYVLRAVNANREHDDARPSDIIYHSFGCWSILGGKIVSSVSTAKKIAKEIKKNLT